MDIPVQKGANERAFVKQMATEWNKKRASEREVKLQGEGEQKEPDRSLRLTFPACGRHEYCFALKFTDVIY